MHETSDHVFRAVIEDWESTAGYSAKAVDVNEPLHGGGKTAEDLPTWSGIHAGVERITGMLGMLVEYCKSETSAPVAIPVGAIVDLVTRMLSVALPPSSAQSSNGNGATRLHPAIDRDERDGLWSGIPQIYVAALQLVNTIAERMEEAFLPISQSSLDQLAWVFPSGKHTPEFRLAAYNLTAKTLFCSGQSLDKAQVGRLSGIIRSCCKDLYSVDPDLNVVETVDSSKTTSRILRRSSNHNADTFLRTTIAEPQGEQTNNTDLVAASAQLLPLLLSHVPQQCLDISLRALVERTAILTHNKSAMLASILNPFVGKNGKAMTSILPHMTREFGHDDVVEILLRPRMPLLPSTSPPLFMEEEAKEASEGEDMEICAEHTSVEEEERPSPTTSSQSVAAVAAIVHPGFGLSTTAVEPATSAFGSHDSSLSVVQSLTTGLKPLNSFSTTSIAPKAQPDDEMDQDDESSGSANESVHLTMQLDTDSDSDD